MAQPPRTGDRQYCESLPAKAKPDDIGQHLARKVSEQELPITNAGIWRSRAKLAASLLALSDDLRGEDSFPEKRPLLAHYTTIQTLDAILQTSEVWLSNPLFMSDIEEVRFGIRNGTQLFLDSAELESTCGEERAAILRSALNQCYKKFDEEHILDTFVLCFSEHEKADCDGLLSMWRGYGGNGSGAAIVFDTAKIRAQADSPLIIAKVKYGTAAERLDWIEQRIKQFGQIICKNDVQPDLLPLASEIFFDRLKLFSVFSKHSGFSEEREWRLVYIRKEQRPEKYEKWFSYWIGPRGVEPKLKLKAAGISDFPEENIRLPDLIDRIILGPSLSSPLSRNAVGKMLDALGAPELKKRLCASQIPYRQK
jgi:hypothetical protein